MVGKTLGVALLVTFITGTLTGLPSPAKGVRPTKDVTELTVPKSLGVTAYKGKHDTKHYEYPQVLSLTVVRGEKTKTVVEYLYSKDGWDELLGLFAGLEAETPEDVETLVAEIAGVVGPFVQPHSWDPELAYPVPRPDGWDVRVGGRMGSARYLIFEIDPEQNEIVKITVGLRQTDREARSKK